jgi:hypothetical protein
MESRGELIGDRAVPGAGSAVRAASGVAGVFIDLRMVVAEKETEGCE